MTDNAPRAKVVAGTSKRPELSVAAPGRSPAPEGRVGRALREELSEVIPLLRHRALKLCLNATEAQDLVQDTVERALRFESSYRPGTNLRAWMHQILFSVFVTRCRRAVRERRALDVLTHDPCAWTRHDEPPPMRALSSGVENALRSLPAPFAAVVRLVDLHEHSYKEAAAELGVPVGTVMSRLFRGRRLLAAELRVVSESTAPPEAEAA